MTSMAPYFLITATYTIPALADAVDLVRFSTGVSTSEPSSSLLVTNVCRVKTPFTMLPIGSQTANTPPIPSGTSWFSHGGVSQAACANAGHVAIFENGCTMGSGGREDHQVDAEVDVSLRPCRLFDTRINHVLSRAAERAGSHVRRCPRLDRPPPARSRDGCWRNDLRLVADDQAVEFRREGYDFARERDAAIRRPSRHRSPRVLVPKLIATNDRGRRNVFDAYSVPSAACAGRTSAPADSYRHGGTPPASPSRTNARNSTPVDAVQHAGDHAAKRITHQWNTR